MPNLDPFLSFVSDWNLISADIYIHMWWLQIVALYSIKFMRKIIKVTFFIKNNESCLYFLTLLFVSLVHICFGISFTFNGRVTNVTLKKEAAFYFILFFIFFLREITRFLCIKRKMIDIYNKGCQTLILSWVLF